MSDALRIERSAAVLTLWLNRPTLHNAFDAALIAQLTAALEAAGRDEQVRAVVLAGQGASFSAGADMQWMRGMAAASEDANREDSLALADPGLRHWRGYGVLDVVMAAAGGE